MSRSCSSFGILERRHDDLSGLRRPRTVGSARSHRPVCGRVCGGIRGMGALRPVRQEKVCSGAIVSHGRKTVLTMHCCCCRAMLSSCVISIAHAIVTNIIAGSQVHRALVHHSTWICCRNSSNHTICTAMHVKIYFQRLGFCSWRISTPLLWIHRTITAPIL